MLEDDGDLTPDPALLSLSVEEWVATVARAPVALRAILDKTNVDPAWEFMTEDERIDSAHQTVRLVMVALATAGLDVKVREDLSGIGPLPPLPPLPA